MLPLLIRMGGMVLVRCVCRVMTDIGIVRFRIDMGVDTCWVGQIMSFPFNAMIGRCVGMGQSSEDPYRDFKAISSRQSGKHTLVESRNHPK